MISTDKGETWGPRAEFIGWSTERFAPATWDDPGMQQLMLGAIQWAVGSVSADITPRPLPKG